MTTYMKVVICALLGIPVPIAYILGGEPVQNIKWIPPMGWITVGGLAVVLYCAIVQFCFARKGHGLAANWPTLVAMLLSLPVPLVFLTLIVGTLHPDNNYIRHHILTNGLPMLISGYLGSFLGVVLAARVKRPADANTAQG
jgi:hypothetical protein